MAQAGEMLEKHWFRLCNIIINDYETSDVAANTIYKG